MRNTVFASALALVALSGAIPAQAMPFPPAGDLGTDVTLAAYGCGPGWTRGPYGRCHPMGYVAPYPAYGVYGHPYAHPYYGHRCWWRGGVRVCG